MVIQRLLKFMDRFKKQITENPDATKILRLLNFDFESCKFSAMNFELCKVVYNLQNYVYSINFVLYYKKINRF